MWQPIATAPKDGRKVLLCKIDSRSEYADWPETFYYEAGDWYSAIDGQAVITQHTHWQPLPPPPQD